MASSGKKKTTMAKLMRESRQRERRQDKLARKEARRLGLSANPDEPVDELEPVAAGALVTPVAGGTPAVEQPAGD